MRWSERSLNDEGDEGVIALAADTKNTGHGDAVDACAGAAALLSEAIEWPLSAASQLHGAAGEDGGRRDACHRAGGVGDRYQALWQRFWRCCTFRHGPGGLHAQAISSEKAARRGALGGREEGVGPE